MRTLVLVGLLSLLSSWIVDIRSEPRTESDCYEAKMVRNWVELPLGLPEGSSFLEKYVYRGGDQVATGIVQGFSREELLNRNRLDRILSVVRLSFSQPQFIVRADAKKPRVTMLLLYFLEHEVSDKDAQKKIVETEKYVSSQAEQSGQSQ